MCEPTKNDLLSFVHPDDRERVRHCAIENMTTESPFEVTYRYLTVEGERDWFLTRCSFVTEGNRRMLYQASSNLTKAGRMCHELESSAQ